MDTSSNTLGKRRHSSLFPNFLNAYRRALWAGLLLALYPLAGRSAPVITNAPTNQLTMVYSNVTFRAGATGTLPLSYQWQRSGTNLVDDSRISGSSSSNLTVSLPQLSDGGVYTIVVTDSSGSASNSATLTVVPIFSWGDGPVMPPAGATNVMGIGAAGQVVNGDFAVRADGSVLGWGANVYGIMDIPVYVTNVASVMAGDEQVIAIRRDGTVATWGYNGTNVPENATNVAAAALQGAGCIALRQDGSLVAWNGATTPPVGATNMIAIGAGAWGSAMGIRQDGTLIGWGDNSYGQASPPPQATNLVALACGDRHTLALRSDGTVIGFGLNASGDLTPPPNASNIVEIAAGQELSLALRNDGLAINFGIMGAAPSYVTNCVAVAARYYHNVALVQDPSVHEPPFITQQPLGAVVRTNQTLILLSRAVGGFPLQYQWLFNSQPLAGQTNRWLLLSPVQTAQGGNYQMVATNSYGAATSAVATVWTPPAFVVQPSAQAVFGSNTTFSVLVAGTQPLAYQWYFNGSPISDGGRFSDSTTTNLAIANFQSSDLGNYTLVASNLAGITTSSVAQVTVANPLISTQPQNQSALGGATVSFSVSATGQAPLQYQWLYNGAELAGATTNPLVLSNVLVSQSGSYSVVVSNGYGSIVSSNATLSVAPFSIFPQPQNRSNLAGSTVTLSVGVSGQGTFGYQWLYNGTNISGAVTNPFTMTNILVSQAGTYSVFITNDYGALMSSNATVTVLPLAFTQQPTDRIVWPNGNATFKATVTGQAPFAYDWRFNGTSIPGATNNVLALTNLQLSQFGTYAVVVSNAYGSLSSSNAALLLSQVAVWGGYYGESNLTPGLTNLLQIAAVQANANFEDCLALRGDGSAMTWPTNLSPFQSYGMSNLIDIVGGSPSYALRATGTVVRLYPEGGMLIGSTNIVALAAYGSLFMLRPDGSVVGSSGGAGGSGFPPTLSSNIVALAQGGSHSLALRSDGSVFAWGSNFNGQTNVPSGATNVIAIAAGNTHSLALKDDSTVIAWGDNSLGQTNVPAGLSNVVAIAAGASHNLALRSDGTVIAWGSNSNGQTNVPTTLTNVIAISAGQTFSMALIGNGPPVTRALLNQPMLRTNSFSASLPTDSGKVYLLEYKNSLSDTNWSALPLVSGTGGSLILKDPSATNSQRVYRARRW